MAESNHQTVSTDCSSSAEIDRSCEETNSMNSEMAATAGTADDAALQRFLQQQLSDRMNELQQIQHAERPVTGQNNRENIAHFMAKHIPEPTGASSKVNIPANVDAVEEHRPEAVVVEVQGVVEQRRVSSMLQSSNFRRHLENIIRGSISTARQSAATASPRIRANNSPRPATPEVAVEPRSRSSSQETVGSSTSNSTAVSSVAQPAGNQNSRTQHITPPPPAEVEPQLGVWRPVQPEQEQEGNIWNTISQVHHEEMVYEISNLLHQRLVSSALASEFRSVMEVHMQNRVSQTEANGEAVEDFIHNIQQSEAHIPNDFRHLGIAPGPRDDNSDNISITGISATDVPYTQTNRHMSRELQSLKSQMEEMKNMMKLSFDLQLDIQRAIRQEVAAALASVTGQGATAAAPAVHSTPVSDTHCLICLENHSDSVLYQCGHMCVCFSCGKSLVTRGNAKCPVCRAPIKDVIRAYKTNVE